MPLSRVNIYKSYARKRFKVTSKLQLVYFCVLCVREGELRYKGINPHRYLENIQQQVNLVNYVEQVELTSKGRFIKETHCIWHEQESKNITF